MTRVKWSIYWKHCEAKDAAHLHRWSFAVLLPMEIFCRHSLCGGTVFYLKVSIVLQWFWTSKISAVLQDVIHSPALPDHRDFWVLWFCVILPLTQNFYKWNTPPQATSSTTSKSSSYRSLATFQYLIVSFRTIYDQKSPSTIAVSPEICTLSAFARIWQLRFSYRALAQLRGWDLRCSHFGSKGVEISIFSSPGPSYSQRSLAKGAYLPSHRPNSPEIDFCRCCQPPQSYWSRSLRSR